MAKIMRPSVRPPARLPSMVIARQERSQLHSRRRRLVGRLSNLRSNLDRRRRRRRCNARNSSSLLFLALALSLSRNERPFRRCQPDKQRDSRVAAATAGTSPKCAADQQKRGRSLSFNSGNNYSACVRPVHSTAARTASCRSIKRCTWISCAQSACKSVSRLRCAGLSLCNYLERRQPAWASPTYNDSTQTNSGHSRTNIDSAVI